jgi:hypothetical protein
MKNENLKNSLETLCAAAAAAGKTHREMHMQFLVTIAKAQTAYCAQQKHQSEQMAKNGQKMESAILTMMAVKNQSRTQNHFGKN